MALLEGNLRTWLLEQSEISALVGNRVYKVRLQQAKSLPAIVISLVTTNAKDTFAGYANLRIRRFQFDIYADEEHHDQVDEVGEAVFRALEGFVGWMGDTRVQRAHLLTENDIDEHDVKQFRRSQDWEIFEQG